MSTVPTGSLLDRIESGRFEHAIFLSYSIDTLFFEVAVLRHLVRRGCGNIVVFADASRVNAELARVGDPRTLGGRSAWGIGRTYSLTPVFHSSAFHPKVALLIGDEIDLVIGSGNLEPGGLRSNLEILHRCRCDREGRPDDVRRLVASTWDYTIHRVAKHISGFVQDQLARVQASLPWVRELGTGGDRPAAQFIAGAGVDAVSPALGFRWTPHWGA
jgi:hypothetical protein